MFAPCFLKSEKLPEESEQLPTFRVPGEIFKTLDEDLCILLHDGYAGCGVSFDFRSFLFDD